MGVGGVGRYFATGRRWECVVLAVFCDGQAMGMCSPSGVLRRAGGGNV